MANKKNDLRNGTAAATEVEERNRKPAEIGAADTFDASGAFQEPAVQDAVDVSSPAVDNNPRAGTTVGQNLADFNDPGLSAEEAVEARLGYGKAKAKAEPKGKEGADA